MKRIYDFIIVGAGINGLQIGALLVNEGASVLVLERSGHIGGRAYVWEKDGFLVDYGIHLIRYGPESAIAKTFRRLGYRIKFKKPGTSYLYEDSKKYIFPTGVSQFLFTSLISAGEKIKAAPLLLKVKRMKDQWKELLHVPVNRWMDENGIKGGLRKYFELVTGSMLVCPFTDIASSGELLFNMAKVLRTGISVMYPSGGWKPLFNFLESKIKENGEIITGTKVTQVVIDGNRVRGVYAGSDFFEGKKVVVNVPVQEMWSFLDEELFPREYVERTKNLIPTSGVVVDMGLKRKVAEEKGLIYFYKPMAFGMFTSNIDPSVAPGGKQLLTFFYPTELKDMLDEESRKKREKEIIDRIFSLWDIEANIEWKRISHLKMVDGAQINVNQTRELRPGYKMPGMENLYLVGDSLGAPGAGGDVGHESVHGLYRTLTGKEI